MGKKILIIDDEIGDTEVMKYLEKSLRSKDNDLYLAKSLSEAVELLKANVFDAIIIDVMMKYIPLYSNEKTNGGLKTGLVLLDDLKGKKIIERVITEKIIIYTNVISEDIKKQILEKYPDVSYVLKPYFNELFSKI